MVVAVLCSSLFTMCICFREVLRAVTIIYCFTILHLSYRVAVDPQKEANCCESSWAEHGVTMKMNVFIVLAPLYSYSESISPQLLPSPHLSSICLTWPPAPLLSPSLAVCLHLSSRVPATCCMLIEIEEIENIVVGPQGVKLWIKTKRWRKQQLVCFPPPILNTLLSCCCPWERERGTDTDGEEEV